MNSINIIKFYPRFWQLKNLIKYFWVLDSNQPMILDHKILPTNNIDIIFNFKAPMTFDKHGVIYSTPGNIYFSGLTDNHTIMKQQGEIQTIGVSFFPTGLYPFFNIPVSEFKNETIGFDVLFKRPAVELEEKLRAIDYIADRILLLENFFLELLDPNVLLTDDTKKLINYFYSSSMGVNEFCKYHGVHPKKLERLFKKFVGASPKRFLRLSRFQHIVSKILKTPQSDLTTLAYEFDFFDQAHFIKDFKAFSGSAPLNFLKEERSFKQIMKLV